MKKFMVLHLVTWIWICGVAHSTRPASVNIGAVFAFNSVIGRVAKEAMEMAVSDVNGDPTVLKGTKLNLIMKDAMCNAFLGSIGAFQLLEKGVAAIIGPQSSAVAHTVSQIADALQVPLVSYAATDPTLSSLQFPFFIRSTQSDLAQMTAMADLIDFNGWKEVIVVFLDDDYGRNGISALSDELEKRRLKISYKLPLSIKFDLDEITNLLNQSKLFGPRVYVVHVNPDPRLRIFSVAHKLQMIAKDYVWLVTDWLSATIGSLSPVNQTSFSVLQGVVGLRQHILDSRKKRAFVSRWTKRQRDGLTNASLNSYGFSAYDTVWAIALSIDKFIKVNNFTFMFHDKYKLSHTEGIGVQLDKLKIFTGGSDLVKILLQSNFTGVSGQVMFNSDRNIVSGGYDIINVNQLGITRVGFWSNYTGFSVVPPATLKKKEHSRFSKDQKLDNITWPGGKTDRPRGWVIADNTKPLRIGVPKRASFVEFVTEVPNSHEIQGYCIDVFKKALDFIPYEVPFVFKPFGNGKANPNYDELVKRVADNVYDAVVGDIAIVTTEMGGSVAATVVFDFDRTIIDDDSDRWIVTELGLTHLFNQLRHTMPWTSLMDRIMEELHSHGITIDHIAECLIRTPLHPNIVSAIKSAHALGCDLRIISDANEFFIRTILEHHGLLGCFSQIYTNRGFVDDEGRLHVTPFHDSTLSPHACSLCPPNMCKGLVIDQIRGSLPGNERKFIYLGDGSGDYCPTLKLKEGDFVMPRKNYPLWNRIHSDPKLVAAEVHDWSNGEELESILLKLINKIAPTSGYVDSHTLPL